MKQDKWIQQLHDKLADYQTDAPEGLWEDIEAAIQTKKPQKSRFIPLRRWAAAACLAAILATGGYWWWNQTGRNLNETKNNQIAQVKETAPNQESTPTQEQGDNTESPHGTIESIQTKPMIKATSIVQTARMVSDTVDSKPSQTQNEITNEQPVEAPSVTQEEHQIIRELDKEIAELSTSHSKTVTINLYAMNGFASQSNINGVIMSNDLLQKFTNPQAYASRPKTPVYLTGYEEREKHYQPLSFGLSVSYPLTNGLSLAAGIVYTRLHSDFLYITPTYQTKKEQTLGYLGIPIQLNYRLWSYNGLKAYFSVGGQADWNISTNLNSNGIEQELKKDHMQWSVNAGLGIEYDIIPQLGLYVEPGLKHYFDNGSPVQNFFKDKPTSFSLMLGIRYNLNSKK